MMDKHKQIQPNLDTHLPKRRRRRAHSLLLAATVPCFGTACEITPHQTQKVTAERQWNLMRSQVQGRLAAEQFQQQRIDEALKTLQEAIRLSPDEPSYRRILAQCLLEKGHYRTAREELDRAKVLGDTSPDLHYVYGLLAEKSGNPDEAFDHYQRARSADPDRVDFLIAVAEMQVARGQLTDALELLKTGLRHFDNDPKILVLRAQVYQLRNEPQLAVSDLRSAAESLPTVTWIREEIALLLVDLRRYEEAMQWFDRMDVAQNHPLSQPGPVDPRNALLVRSLAQCHLRTGQPQHARELLENHLGHSPNDARAWQLLAEVALLQNDFALAKRCADTGARIAPDQPHWNLIRACVTWQQDDTKATQEFLQKIVTRHPDHVVAHCFLGDTYQKSNQEKAREHYESALSTDPNCQWATQRLTHTSARK